MEEYSYLQQSEISEKSIFLTLLVWNTVKRGDRECGNWQSFSCSIPWRLVVLKSNNSYEDYSFTSHQDWLITFCISVKLAKVELLGGSLLRENKKTGKQTIGYVVCVVRWVHSWEKVWISEKPDFTELASYMLPNNYYCCCHCVLAWIEFDEALLDCVKKWWSYIVTGTVVLACTRSLVVVFMFSFIDICV